MFQAGTISWACVFPVIIVFLPNGNGNGPAVG